jgi:hypothetical protein
LAINFAGQLLADVIAEALCLGRAALQEANDDNDQSDHQQYINQSTECVRGNESEQPQNQENEN